MAGDDASATSSAPPPQPEPRPRGRRPLTNPREELLNGPKHGGQALFTGVGLPAPVNDVPDTPPGPADDAAADGAGRRGESRTDDEES
ncbi:hypothetical protein ACFU9X_27925 [Streptomyces atratus]|uniref:hypothetical protein n=1 Tax=Streptomyces atratus TaxID=1893 RepID=UPI0036B7DF0A